MNKTEIKEKFKEFVKKKLNITEKTADKGIYLAAKFTQSNEDDLFIFIKDNNIPSTLTRDDFHSTIIYSRKYADLPINDTEDLGYAEPEKFHIFETQEGKRALVILLKSDYLLNRHNELMKKYDLTYDFEEYLPHATLSYDIGDFDISVLNIKDLPKHFTINTEYKEDLDLDKSYSDVSDKEKTN